MGSNTTHLISGIIILLVSRISCVSHNTSIYTGLDPPPSLNTEELLIYNLKNAPKEQQYFKDILVGVDQLLRYNPWTLP